MYFRRPRNRFYISELDLLSADQLALLSPSGEAPLIRYTEASAPIMSIPPAPPVPLSPLTSIPPAPPVPLSALPLTAAPASLAPSMGARSFADDLREAAARRAAAVPLAPIATPKPFSMDLQEGVASRAARDGAALAAQIEAERARRAALAAATPLNPGAADIARSIGERVAQRRSDILTGIQKIDADRSKTARENLLAERAASLAPLSPLAPLAPLPPVSPLSPMPTMAPPLTYEPSSRYDQLTPEPYDMPPAYSPTYSPAPTTEDLAAYDQLPPLASYGELFPPTYEDVYPGLTPTGLIGPVPLPVPAALRGPAALLRKRKKKKGKKMKGRKGKFLGRLRKGKKGKRGRFGKSRFSGL